MVEKIKAASLNLEGIEEESVIEEEEPKTPPNLHERPEADYSRVQIVFVMIDGLGDYSYPVENQTQRKTPMQMADIPTMDALAS